MGSRAEGERPRAREADLVVELLLEETLVYDLVRHKAFCLGPRTAWVWRQCDGKTTVEEIAKRLARELREPVGEEVIWVALRRLARAHLMQASPPPASGRPSASRREWIRRAALLGGFSILSLTVPVAALAASCLPKHATCNPAGPNRCCPPCRCVPPGMCTGSC
ncbi:MAG TPA: PqqD family protein [Vicinamibacteria bacterium]|nr:PqqD family protein [Vicinamibacteria bacterium]